MINTYTHIALDLELEQPKTRADTTDSHLEHEKIIQVGWTVFTIDPLVILKKQSKFINIGVPLSAFIKKLTGITDKNISSGGTLTEAYDALVQDAIDFKTLRVVKQWGGGDMDCLKKELWLEDPLFKWEFGRSGFNVKHVYQMYAEATGKNRSGGLKKSMRKCGLAFDGGAHDASVDAYNTAKFYDFLLRSIK